MQYAAIILWTSALNANPNKRTGMSSLMIAPSLGGSAPMFSTCIVSTGGLTLDKYVLSITEPGN